VWNTIERGSNGRFKLTLINPQHVRALPGRKTDQQDCERIAELHQYGLLAASFIPPKPIRQLRDLTRRRAHVQQDRNRIINRIDRWLETANCKLGSVASNIVGKTGRLILDAIVRGEKDPERLAAMAQGTLQLKKADLARALQGRYTEHFRWLLKDLLADLARLDEKVEPLERRISEYCAPYADLIRRLCTIPTIKLTTAQTLLAELGADMTQFDDSAHLASWAGLCPGNNESAGQRQSGRTRKGNHYVRRTLIQNAWAVAHMKSCSLTSVFFRIAARRGQKKAAVAIAHKILVIAFHVIRGGEVYHELGDDLQDRLHPLRTVHRLTRRLENPGFDVQLTERAESTPAAQTVGPRKKKRGRPCLCHKRGILCIHGT
jgi:transposase